MLGQLETRISASFLKLIGDNKDRSLVARDVRFTLQYLIGKGEKSQPQPRFSPAPQKHLKKDDIRRREIEAAPEGLAIDMLFMDCDGIIFDSNNLKTEAYRRALGDMGVPATQVEKYIELHLSDVSVPPCDKFKKFFTDIYPLEDPAKAATTAIAQYGRQCRSLYINDLSPRPEALRMAKIMRSVVVVSGGMQATLREVFREHGITHYFQDILGSPTHKAEHVRRVISEAGVKPSRCLFIGDGWTDMKTAQKFGLHFVFLDEMSDWADADKRLAEARSAMLSGAGDAPPPGCRSITRCKTWDKVIRLLSTYS